MKKIHRFIGAFDLRQPVILLKDAGMVAQLQKVLRVTRGDEVVLCDGRGKEARCTITEMDKTCVTVAVKEPPRDCPSAPVRVELYCAMIKRENFDLVVQKAAEIGVARIIPLRTRRTIKTEIKRSRMEKIVTEAAELCGRGTVPVIEAPMEWEQALQETASCTVRIICDREGEPLPAVLRRASDASSMALCIGPEGGWDEDEMRAAKDAGLDCVTMGELVLRAETAAIVASYLACHAASPIR